MSAVESRLKLGAIVLIFNLCFNEASWQGATQPLVCSLCNGSVRVESQLDQFCLKSAGRIDGRCCFGNDSTGDPERLIGLDLSNCSLNHVENLQWVPTVVMIDLSLNPIVNMTDKVFQGFRDLNYMILPQDVTCPGGNTSWQNVEIKEGNCFCTGQKNMCNHTDQLYGQCPENSLCEPYGPGFYECSCVEGFRGYKCLRRGDFPTLLVFGPLAASTALISFLLWATQRRKAKSL